MIKVGVIGGSGYTGGELLRLLIHHPEVHIEYVYSTSKVGSLISETHPDLLSLTDLRYTDRVEGCDVLFLCTGHGTSVAMLESHPVEDSTLIVDLSRDFRLAADQEFGDRRFVYGLPALCRDELTTAKSIANPGCFATAIQLALLPLAKAQLLNNDVHINAVTGSTGAGAKLSPTSHFSWRNNNVSWYKAFRHQHIDEIRQSLGEHSDAIAPLIFLPQRGCFTRGIFATAYLRCDLEVSDIQQLYSEYYADEPFVQISEAPIALKPVVNTNNCHIHIHKEDDLLLITSAIDNLLKGASGQAVQNMNIACGLPETTGLQLKSTFF